MSRGADAADAADAGGVAVAEEGEPAAGENGVQETKPPNASRTTPSRASFLSREE